MLRMEARPFCGSKTEARARVGGSLEMERPSVSRMMTGRFEENSVVSWPSRGLDARAVRIRSSRCCHERCCWVALMNDPIRSMKASRRNQERPFRKPLEERVFRTLQTRVPITARMRMKGTKAPLRASHRATMNAATEPPTTMMARANVRFRIFMVEVILTTN